MAAVTVWMLMLVAAAAAAEAEDGGVVTLSHGGRVAPVSLASYTAYFAIPYAKPPLGQLRFQAPQAAEAWPGVRRPDSEGSDCMQDRSVLLLGASAPAEDCLFLNVYTDTLPAAVSQPRPVMVWIHGGGFAIGSGSRRLYGPDFLVPRGVLLVTLNYRLGPFGFLCTGDSAVAGNMGLKDQALALRWVRDNIAAFGGDPGNVTIFGESAGAASVHLHMLSPASRGLFSRAISQSGSALSPWATVAARQAARVSRALAAAVGCHGDQSHALAACLRNVPAADLSAAATTVVTAPQPNQVEYNPFHFLPVVEDFLAEEERGGAFLAADPRQLMREGRFSHVPYIAGLNSHEALPFLPILMMRRSSWAPGGSGYRSMLPRRLRGSCGEAQLQQAANRLWSFYFSTQRLDDDAFTQMMSDALFFDGIQETIELFAASSTSPVYEYLFEVNGERNLLKRMTFNSNKPGACHGDELGYLFWMQLALLPPPAPASLEERTIARMTAMWTDFARTGDPTPGAGGVGVAWPPYDAASQSFLRIGERPSAQQRLWPDRRAFWANLTC